MKQWGLLLLLTASALFMIAPQTGQDLPVLAYPPGQSNERLVAKEASLTLLVADTDRALQALEQAALHSGGQVASLNFWTVTDQQRNFKAASLTLRIPAGNFEAALVAVRQPALAVEAEAVSGVDHTKEINNLESQLRWLESEKARLENLLEAGTYGQSSNRIQQELEDAVAEYDQVFASYQALMERVEWANISIELNPFIPTLTPTLIPTPTLTATPTPLPKPTPWDIGLVYRRSQQYRRVNWISLCCLSILLFAFMVLVVALVQIRKRR